MKSCIFPIRLNVLYFKDYELHPSCGSSSDVGNLAADSSGDLAWKPQLSSTKEIQCLNLFKPARDSNLHDSVSHVFLLHL